MSGALVATMSACTVSTVVFIGVAPIANGQDTSGAPYSVPSFTAIGDTVLFYSVANSQGRGSSPPGDGWTGAPGSLGGGNGVFVKRMVTNSDLAVTTTSSGGSLAFAVYRGVASFAPVSGNGFNRSPSHAGVTFFGPQKPSPATARLTFSTNTLPAVISDMLPPINYINGTDYNQYTAVEFRSQ